MKTLIKRAMCMVMLLMVMVSDVGYVIWAAQDEYKQKIDSEKVNVKEKYTKKEREKLVKRVYDKMKKNEKLTHEEILLIDSNYDDLEIVLPTDEAEWEVDHEKGVGLNNGIMALSGSTVESALYRNKKTTVVDVGSIPGKNFDNGEGDWYCFSDYVRTSFIMPGMKQTSLGNSTCSRMIPQGICCYGGYIFITAYCEDETHNSVIYVLNTSGKYITTLVTNAEIHAGGIVYANGYLWVGDTDATRGYLYYYNYSQIKEAIEIAKYDSTVTAINLAEFGNGKISLAKGDKASFLTVYNGYICVGEYEGEEDYVGELNLYNPVVLLNGIVNKQTIGTIPKDANGVLFYTTGNRQYMIINSNLGRNENSRIHVFSVIKNSYVISMKKTKTIHMPCMVEEAFSYGSYTYFVFESCGEKYREGRTAVSFIINKPDSVIGRVCGLSTPFIFKQGGIRSEIV